MKTGTLHPKEQGAATVAGSWMQHWGWRLLDCWEGWSHVTLSSALQDGALVAHRVVPAGDPHCPRHRLFALSLAVPKGPADCALLRSGVSVPGLDLAQYSRLVLDT